MSFLKNRFWNCEYGDIKIYISGFEEKNGGLFPVGETIYICNKKGCKNEGFVECKECKEFKQCID